MATILVVDDQPQFRRALRLSLALKGYEIREAGSGADALELLRCESPDLILVDWMMPGMDGIQFCLAIRQRSDVPIIMLTSKRGGRDEALAAGANEYVQKPFAVEALLSHIQSALHRHPPLANL